MNEQTYQWLINNSSLVLATTAGIGLVVLGILYMRARLRHVVGLRNRLNGAIRLPDQVMQTLSKVLNVNSAEFATIGTVTFVDLSWHYSMADPQIWDHFNGPGAQHIADAIQNLDILRSSLGSQGGAIMDNVFHYVQGLEATSIFHETTARLAETAGAAAQGAVASVSALALDAPGQALVERLGKAGNHALQSVADAKAGVVGDTGGLLLHVPLVTIGFASYRAWKRAQSGAGLARNLEFAAIEVTTRAGGGILGGQLGGAIGTAMAPGVGTIVGSVAGAVAGAISGAILGEEFKQRHVKQASQKLDSALVSLGELHLDHPGRFRELNEVFIKQEKEYENNLRQMQGRLFRYSLLPWRVVWPNETLVLLQETVRMAQERLAKIKKGALDAVDQLTYMQAKQQHREMGVILWSDPALRTQLTTDPSLISAVEKATEKLRHEVVHLGVNPQAAQPVAAS
jgi:hypothetical protein